MTGFTLLICEEDDNMRSVLQEFFPQYGFVVVQPVRNNPLQVNRLANSADAMLISALPDTKFCRRMLNMARDVDIPKFVSLCSENADKRALAKAMGATDIISRPFDIAEISAMIQSRILDFKKHKSGNTSITIDGLSVDTKENKATLNGKQIALSPRETEILYLLLTNPNKAFTRAELAYCGTTNKIRSEHYADCCMSHIRKALGKPWSERIRSVRGIGYMLEL